MGNWNFGIIGAGLIADFHARASGDIPGGRVVGFCDNGSGRADMLAKKYQAVVFGDYRDLISNHDINIIAVATPSGFHLEPTVFAATQGKHVIFVKPLEVTLERIEQMIETH